jgi:hypothetical protein
VVAVLPVLPFLNATQPLFERAPNEAFGIVSRALNRPRTTSSETVWLPVIDVSCPFLNNRALFMSTSTRI